MALVHPFRAYRYSADTVGDLERVVTQPYDKIPAALQENYHVRSPWNVVRITKSLEKNSNPETDYPEAAATLDRWIAERVLVRDREPAIYPYYQDYEVDGERLLRKGFIALLDLRHAGSDVLAHERTLAEPKQDRLRLIRRIECNEDLIFMLYTDERLAVNRILDARTAVSPPEIEVRDDFGACHRLWSITDAASVKKIRDAMVAEELFIADGHHRYETSVTFMGECDSRGWKPAAIESFDKRLVACFNSADTGLTILPTHRLVRGLDTFDSRAFLRSAEQYFDLEPVVSAEALRDRMKLGAGREHLFGFYARAAAGFHLMRLREEAKVDPLMLAHPEVYRHLDVSILHTLVLDRLLGIDEAKVVSQSHVDYARDRETSIQRVDQGEAQAAFFLNPTTVEQVLRVAVTGERMPQKSTDFYPKLLTGLVFMKMEISRGQA